MIVKNPLLSLKATGSIGHAVTYAPWKGMTTARQYARTPNNPTPVQQQIQCAHDKAVKGYQAYQQRRYLLDAWKLGTTQTRRFRVYGNYAITTIWEIAEGGNDPIMVWWMEWFMGVVRIQLINVYTGALVIWPGVAKCRWGYTPRKLEFEELNSPFWPIDIVFDLTSHTQPVVYAEFEWEYPSGFERASGIFRINF